MSDTWLSGRLSEIETQIEQLEAAVVGLNDGTILSYDLDSGQNRHRVTRQNIEELNKAIRALYERRQQIRLRCGLDRGVTRVTPCF